MPPVLEVVTQFLHKCEYFKVRHFILKFLEHADFNIFKDINAISRDSVETSDDLQEIPLRRLIPCTHLAMDDPRQADNTTLGRVGSITRKPVPTPRASTLKKVGTKICCL